MQVGMYQPFFCWLNNAKKVILKMKSAKIKFFKKKINSQNLTKTLEKSPDFFTWFV
jgi:hypothetical protein